MNLDDLDGRIGEGWGGHAPDGAHVNVVLARRGSPTAAAVVMMCATLFPLPQSSLANNTSAEPNGCTTSVGSRNGLDTPSGSKVGPIARTK